VHPGRLRFSELPEGIDDPQLGCHPRSGSPSAASSSAVSGCVPPQEKGETSDLLRLTAVFPSLRLNTSTITGVGCLGKPTNRVIRLSHPWYDAVANRPIRRRSINMRCRMRLVHEVGLATAGIRPPDP